MAQRESTTRSAVQAMVGLVETRTDATCHELAVLEKLAGAASSEYDQIEKQTTGIAAFDEDLSHRARDCSHLFTEIDELDANIDKLESVVEQLSEYSIHLEKRLQTATSAP